MLLPASGREWLIFMVELVWGLEGIAYKHTLPTYITLGFSSTHCVQGVLIKMKCPERSVLC